MTPHCVSRKPSVQLKGWVALVTMGNDDVYTTYVNIPDKSEKKKNSDSVRAVLPHHRKNSSPQEASHNGKKFSWSQYPHPLYYTKWEKLLGKPNQQPAQARKNNYSLPTDLTHTNPDEISLYTPTPSTQ